MAADTTFLLDIPDNSVERLNRLIEAMLGLAHASTFSLKYELVDLSATASNSTLVFRCKRR